MTVALPDASDALRDQHAIVTGGGRGLGAAIASALAAQGARLSLLGRDAAVLRAHTQRLADGGASAAAIECDVSDADAVAQAFAEAHAHHGRCDILVNNAGQAEGGPFADLSRETWDRMLAVNLTGTFLCSQRVVAEMMAARSGRIINIASTAALRGYSSMAAYVAAKHGVLGLTRALAIETSRYGVTVNAVCPGYSDTGMAVRAVDAVSAARGISRDEALGLISSVSPRGYLVAPEEVAATVVWLCSPAAAAVTGQAIAVAGGEVMS